MRERYGTPTCDIADEERVLLVDGRRAHAASSSPGGQPELGSAATGRRPAGLHETPCSHSDRPCPPSARARRARGRRRRRRRSTRSTAYCAERRAGSRGRDATAIASAGDDDRDATRASRRRHGGGLERGTWHSALAPWEASSAQNRRAKIRNVIVTRSQQSTHPTSFRHTTAMLELPFRDDLATQRRTSQVADLHVTHPGP